jgi:hypothetical protein
MLETLKKIPALVIGHFQDRYSWGILYRLFAICAFPIHLWAILMVFNDVGWISGRTGVFDTIGYAAYVLLFSLVESLVVFLAVLALSAAASLAWPREKLYAASGGLYLNVALAGGITQVYLFYKDLHPDLDNLIMEALPFNDPRLDRWAILLSVGLAVFLPLLLQVISIIRSERFTTRMNDFLEKIVVLSSIYLGLDALALLLILLRNLFGETIRDLL